MTTDQYDGVWRPERDFNGRWIAARYVRDLDLNHQETRERDVEWVKGYEVPQYFDVLGPCEDRCSVLNRKT
jgi:hypothetical protein